MSERLSDSDESYPKDAHTAFRRAYVALLDGETVYTLQYSGADYRRCFDELFSIAHDMESKTPFGPRRDSPLSSMTPKMDKGYEYRKPTWEIVAKVINMAYPLTDQDGTISAGRWLIHWLRYFQEKGYCSEVLDTYKDSCECELKLFLEMLKLTMVYLDVHLGTT